MSAATLVSTLALMPLSNKNNNVDWTLKRHAGTIGGIWMKRLVGTPGVSETRCQVN